MLNLIQRIKCAVEGIKVKGTGTRGYICLCGKRKIEVTLALEIMRYRDPNYAT